MDSPRYLVPVGVSVGDSGTCVFPPLYMKNVGWDEHEVLGHLPSLHTIAYLGLTNSQCVVIDRISRKPISVELGSRAEHEFGIWKRWENRHLGKQAVCKP